MRERTAASEGVKRELVRFEVATSDLVRSAHPVLRFGGRASRRLELYPGFLMMRETRGEFALIEYRETTLDVSPCRFIEEGRVPPDAETVGYTWKKANKDGSRDRRFNDNRQIPIALYGDLSLTSPAGLWERYEFSNYEKTAAFLTAFNAHVRALARLESAPAAAPPADAQHEVDESADRPPATASNPAPYRPNLAPDWIVLAALVLLATWSAFTLARSHPKVPAPPMAQAQSANSAPNKHATDAPSPTLAQSSNKRDVAECVPVDACCSCG